MNKTLCESILPPQQEVFNIIMNKSCESIVILIWNFVPLGNSANHFWLGISVNKFNWRLVSFRPEIILALTEIQTNYFIPTNFQEGKYKKTIIKNLVLIFERRPRINGQNLWKWNIELKPAHNWSKTNTQFFWNDQPAYNFDSADLFPVSSVIAKRIITWILATKLAKANFGMIQIRSKNKINSGWINFRKSVQKLVEQCSSFEELEDQ